MRIVIIFEKCFELCFREFIIVGFFRISGFFIGVLGYVKVLRLGFCGFF